MAEAEGGSEQDDVSFLRTVCICIPVFGNVITQPNYIGLMFSH